MIKVPKLCKCLPTTILLRYLKFSSNGGIFKATDTTDPIKLRYDLSGPYISRGLVSLGPYLSKNLG